MRSPGSPRAPRGFTLVELMVAAALMMVVVAAALMLVMNAGSMAHDGEQRGYATDSARLGSDVITKALRRAGLGARGGIFVNQSGTPVQINAVFGGNAVSGGTDDLYVVTADSFTFAQDCSTKGTSASLTANNTGGSALTVNCTAPFTVGDLLLVSNMSTAALLSNVTLGANSINSSDLSSGFTDSKANGFQVGDLVTRATVYHFFIQTNPTTNRKALYMNTMKPGAGTPPLVAVEGAAQLVQNDIEDLQVAYGFDTTPPSGNPASYTFQHGLGSAFNSGAALRAVRVTLVGVSARRTQESGDTRSLNSVVSYAPVTVEDHAPTPTPDGLRRSVVARRIELVNLAPENL